MNVFNLRYGKVFKIPRFFAKHFLSLFYPLIIRVYPLPKIKSKEETIQKILDEGCSIVRYGDSEILFIAEKLNLPYQEYDPMLARKMADILRSHHDRILVGLPNGYLPPSQKKPTILWRSQIVWNYPTFRKQLDLNKQYFNASITRLYYNSENIERTKRLFAMIRKIWENRDVVLIEGEKSRLGVGNDLLSNSKSVVRILGPMHHAFRRYDCLFAEALKHDRSKLILVAMGPTAKVLAYELALEGFQAIDIGNIDLEYEWFKMGVKQRVKVKGKYTSEVKGGREVEDVQDPLYKSQIVAHFSLSND
jgi:glycosyltransferase family protein